MAKQKKEKLIGQVRTRIAPSPTGYPHVGTAFQALFDWVYARRYDGQYILRIEDTDQKRLVVDAEEVLYQAFSWLDLLPDEGPKVGGQYGPYRQSERLELYQQYAQQLVEQGDAYYCFCSAERLTQIRETQRKTGQPPMYDRHCRNLSLKEAKARIEAGKKVVVRLKVPDDQTIRVYDELRGEVKFDSNIVDDQVLLKSDGFPTYHLAVVVDDHLMGITHIVRGEEWLSSAPKHVLLYQYFNWPIPKLIHTPTLRNPDKSKLSKRKGNTSLWWYREHGYLPTALLNFLALLVWKPNEQTEIFTRKEMVKFFEWREMNVTGPIFDIKKLNWLNGKYLRKLSKEELEKHLSEWADWVEKKGQDQEVVNEVKLFKEWKNSKPNVLRQAVSLAKDRARTLREIPQAIAFYFESDLEYDGHDLLQDHEAVEMIKVLTAVDQQLLEIQKNDSQVWEKTIRQAADKHDLSHKDLFMALRSAVTAQKYTPPLYEVMTILGREESSKRIQQAINFLKN
ncbi:MAG: glutamate--tRNA ligase [Patescibacteria group bacterium]|nr:glutamate--tRNA ligase [Patescibacteria group bacterium]